MDQAGAGRYAVSVKFAEIRQENEAVEMQLTGLRASEIA
jgi:hypothetical protein